MVTGEPFVIDGVTHTPHDKLNYDEVGYALVGSEGGGSVTAAHKTLPLPSYAEVTSLQSGATILVRIERRGPMRNDALIELSPGAAAQLGVAAAPHVPVRVRRVNPAEPERALLRAGGQAPERMATPRSLLEVLSGKLDGPAPSPPVAAAATAPAPAPEEVSAPAAPEQDASTEPKSAAAVPMPAGQPATDKAAQSGTFVVQAAAFSTEERATRAAKALGGFVTRDGRYWKLRTGPYESRAEAEAALAKARSAGYSDARIQRAD